MACNHPPPPPPLGRENSASPAPPRTPLREDNQPPKNIKETDFEEEFSFPVLEEVFVQNYFFPAFKVAPVVEFDEESIGDMSLNDDSDDDEDEAHEGENGKGTNENGTKPPMCK